MKLKTILIITMATLGLLPFNSCQKETNQKTNSNKIYESTAKRIYIGKKIANNNDSSKLPGGSINNPIFQIDTKVGHSAKGCYGCVLVHGNLVHMDCQGYGNVCTKSISVEFCNNSNAIFYKASGEKELYSANILLENDLTEENYFEFPSRSLKVEDIETNGEAYWMNIPEQVLERNSQTKQFILQGIFYSEVPFFNND